MDGAYELFGYLNVHGKGMRFRKEDVFREAFHSDAGSDTSVKEAAWKKLRAEGVIAKSSDSTYYVSQRGAARYAEGLKDMNRRIEERRRATAAALAQRQTADRGRGSGVRPGGSGVGPSPAVPWAGAASSRAGRAL